MALKRETVIMFLVFFVLIILVASASFLLFYRRQPISLPAVEIKDYQGERLDSISSLKENAISGPQYVDKNSYRLEITGLVAAPAKYRYDDILKLPSYQKVATLNCVEGWDAKILWEGVLVRDLLKNVSIKPEATTIIFYATDNYSTSFPLDYVLKNDIIMASKVNGLVLPPEKGFPFQLVAEQKWGYKWIKWINKIELSTEASSATEGNYKGYWESRGYSNSGNLDEPKFAQ